jgi:hypothetical protein
MAAAPPLWLILRRRLRLVPEEHDAKSTVAFFGAPREPPRATIFEVTSSAHRGSDKQPYIISTAPSALLLGFSVADAPTVTDELLLVRPPGDDSTPRTSYIDFVRRRVRPATYDANSITLTFSFGTYTIAELKVTKSSDRANLLLLVSNDPRFDSLFSSGDDEDIDQWTEVDLPCPLPNREREWSPCGVVDHDKNLWWFDLSWGLLSCNPTAIPIVLRFHDLPPGCDVGEPTNPDIHTTLSRSADQTIHRRLAGGTHDGGNGGAASGRRGVAAAKEEDRFSLGFNSLPRFVNSVTLHSVLRPTARMTLTRASSPILSAQAGSRWPS